jgi:hypothetical protein
MMLRCGVLPDNASVIPPSISFQSVKDKKMTNLVNSVSSDKTGLPSDGSLAATVTAIIHDDTGAVAANVEVDWVVTGGVLSAPSSTSDENGVATIDVTASAAGMVKVTATTADDATGKSVNIYASAPLTAPTVSGATAADLYTLDYYDLKLGVQMVIPHYLNAAAGDTLTFFWGNYSHADTLSNPSTQLPMVIDISNDIPPDELQDGNYSVYYTATDAAGNASYSSALPVVVYNGGETSPTLTRPGIPAAADGYINIADASNDVEVDVAYASMAAGDLITLYWPAMDANGNAIMAATTSIPYTAVAGDTSHAFMVPSALFFPNSGEGYEGSVSAYYTVQPQGATTVELSYSVDVTVDTVPPGQDA